MNRTDLVLPYPTTKLPLGARAFVAMLAFAGKVDCVLLVAAAESTSIAEIDRCERELAAQTNVLGVVLNKCRYTEPSYGYGYGY